MNYMNKKGHCVGKYEKISKNFKRWLILQEACQERELKIEQLQKQTDTSEKELKNLLNRYEKYFNIRKKRRVSKSLYRQHSSIAISLRIQNKSIVRIL